MGGNSAYWPDLAHQGNNYFSIDFSWRNVFAGVGHSKYSQNNIPVLAAAGGKVIVSADSGPSFPNGNYIVIDHDYDGSLLTGFTTRYLHLKDRPMRSDGSPLKTGDIVSQGDQIGTMGTTGQLNGTATSTGVHLHFGVRYNNSGASSVPELAKVIMDGWLLKSFQTECSANQVTGVPIDLIRYYRSLNRAY